MFRIFIQVLIIMPNSDDIRVDEWRYTGMGYNVKIKNNAKLRKAHGAAGLANVACSIPHV